MAKPGLREMGAFAAVAERRSFAKAAKELGVSRSALSETIRALETRLGVRLLNRTTRSVAPTAAGERLLTHLQPLLADFAAAIEDLGAFRDKPAGLVRLTVAPPRASSCSIRRSRSRSPSMRRSSTSWPSASMPASAPASAWHAT